jgi:sec-independent protein translocase protein TatC
VATALRRRGKPRAAPESMTLSEHLGELRRRLIVAVIGFVVAAVVVYVLYPEILRFLIHPLCVQTHKPTSRCNLTVFGPLDAFAVRLNVTAYGGLVLAGPVIFFELWRFVTPGLKANEKKYAVPFAVTTAGLFVLGAFIAWLTFPHALAFLHAVGGPNINDLFTPSKYLGLILALMAIFGVTFEFPAVLVGLELAKVLTPQRLSRWRRPAIVLIVVFAAVVTPSSDPFSMLAMAVPMLAFYEGSILIGRLIVRRRAAAPTA